MQSQSKPITISILIPVYNVADYVEECLNSILVQIDDNAEIIVMNDASTDNSWEVLKAYQTHPKITLVQAPHNRGLSGTRNALLPLATNQYVWFIDSDDAMHDGAYTKVVNALASMDIDMLGGNYMAWRGDNKRPKKAFVGPANQIINNDSLQFIKNIVENNSNHVWNKVYKRSVIEKISFQQGKKFEDIYYMTDLSKVIKNFAFIDYPLIDYRERQGSIIQTLDKKYVDDYLGAFLYRVSHLKANLGEDPSFQNYLHYKTYNRYAGLVKKLKDNQQLDMLNYLKDHFDIEFDHIHRCIGRQIGWIRYQKLGFKHRQTEKILSQ